MTGGVTVSGLFTDRTSLSCASRISEPQLLALLDSSRSLSARARSRELVQFALSAASDNCCSIGRRFFDSSEKRKLKLLIKFKSSLDEMPGPPQHCPRAVFARRRQHIGHSVFSRSVQIQQNQNTADLQQLS